VNVIFQKIQTAIKSKIPKMICGILATISIVVIGFILLPSFWFWVCWEIAAAGLVAVGCGGEWYMFLNPAKDGHETPHRRRELQFITAVAIGVIMEFFALGHAIPEAMRLEKEAADARRESGDAIKQAGLAHERAARAEERTANTESTNLMLSIQLETLRKEYGEFAQDVEMTVAPRMVRYSEEAVSRLSPFSNTAIALMYIGPRLRDPSSRRVPQWEDGEQLLSDMTSVLRQAKWNVLPAPTNLPNSLRVQIHDLNAVWIAKKDLMVNWVTEEERVEYMKQDKRIEQAAKCLADELTTNRIAVEISDGYVENEPPMTLPHSMLLVVIGDHPNQFEEMRREEDRKRVGDRINNMQPKQNPSQPR
jgi:hypothetical protein